MRLRSRGVTDVGSVLCSGGELGWTGWCQQHCSMLGLWSIRQGQSWGAGFPQESPEWLGAEGAGVEDNLEDTPKDLLIYGYVSKLIKITDQHTFMDH